MASSSSAFQPLALEPTTEIYPDDSIAHRVMYNSVIMQRLLHLCPKSEWKKLRLVSKLWNRLLLKAWREHVFVKYTDLASENPNYMHGLTFISTLHPDANSKDPCHYGPHPFRKLRTMPGLWIELCPEQNPFWSMCGHWLKMIDLHNAEIVDMEALELLLFKWTPNLQVFEWFKCLSQERQESEFEFEYHIPEKKQLNLKEIRITMMEMETPEDDLQPNFPISWMELLSTCPNVQSITLNYLPSSSCLKDFENIVQAIDSVRKATNGTALKLKEFHTLNIVHRELLNTIEEAISSYAVEVLAQANLPLEILSLNITGMLVESFEKVLRSYEPTLKKLYLRGRNVDICPYPCESLSQNITEMQLHGAIFRNWDFLAYVPNIEQLQVLAQMWPQLSMANMFETPVSPLVHLKKFEYQCGAALDPEFVERLTELMPNVTAVAISLDSPTFPVVCDHWSQLEMLVIHMPNVEEQIFVENAYKLKNLKRLCFCEMELNGVVYPTAGVFSHGRYTDASIPEGFLRMQRLQELSIVLSSEVTVDALNALKNGVRNTANVFVGSREPDVEPIPLAVAVDVPSEFTSSTISQIVILWQR